MLRPLSDFDGIGSVTSFFSNLATWRPAAFANCLTTFSLTSCLLIVVDEVVAIIDSM